MSEGRLILSRRTQLTWGNCEGRLHEPLDLVKERVVSDLLISAGAPPMLRVNGSCFVRATTSDSRTGQEVHLQGPEHGAETAIRDG